MTNLGLLSQLAEERPADKEPLPDFGVGDTRPLNIDDDGTIFSRLIELKSYPP